MINFATEFPLAPGATLDRFAEVVEEWITGSPHTQVSASTFADARVHLSEPVRVGGEAISIATAATEGRQLSGIRYTRQEDGGLEWDTTVVGVLDDAGLWVGIRILCESHRPTVHLPAPKKPLIVKYLLTAAGGGEDGGLTVSDKPYHLKNSDIELATGLIRGTYGNRLPVVYVSAPFVGASIVDPSELARWLSGMAHVVVEPNRPFSLRLMTAVDESNVYGGTVGIYWPDGAGRRAFFLRDKYSTASEVQSAIAEELRIALTNRRPLARCTWSQVQEVFAAERYSRLKAQGNDAIEDYIAKFDAENRGLTARLESADAEVQRLRAELRRYEARAPAQAGGLVAGGNEKDLYPGERREIIVAALEEALRAAQNDGRRAHVLKDMIAANPVQGVREEFEQILKDALKDYRSMGSQTRSALEGIGFEISADGKHYKAIYRGDPRYTFVLPKTSSDHRAGKNLTSDIRNKLF